ncbi:hypothetical protein E2320_000114 [Naja naja]|nr:hypothetical protein E2320_000114 [Naja naja]
MLKIHIILGSEFSLRKWKSLKIHFILGSGFPEQFSQGISQNDRMEIIDNPFMLGSELCLRKWKMLQSTSFSIEVFLRKAYLKIWPEHIPFDSELDLKNTSFSCSPGWKTLKIHFIFRFELFLRTYLKAYLKMSSDFDKKLIFMFPRLEIIANLLHFNLSFPCGVSTGHISKLGLDFEKHFIFMKPRVENIEIHFILMSFLEELSQGISQNSSDFEKTYFHVPQVENIENPLHFSELSLRITPGISQNVVELNSVEDITFDSELEFRKTFIFMFPRVENVENPLHFQTWAFPEDLAQGKSQNLGFRKTLHFHILHGGKIKIHIIFDSGFSLRSYPKAYLKMWKLLKIHFILIRAFLRS